MSDDGYTMILPGKPMTWARAKANFRRGNGPVYFTADDRRAKMGEIALLWHALGYPQLAGPLMLDCEFLFDRPKAHFTTAGGIRPKEVHTRPGSGKYGGDIDNLVKIVQDALNTVAYDDDRQIAELKAVKRYVRPGERQASIIQIIPLWTESVVQAEQLPL